MADIKMIAHEMKEGIASHELMRAVDGMPVPQWLFLVDELQSPGMVARYLRISLLVTRAYDQADRRRYRLPPLRPAGY